MSRINELYTVGLHAQTCLSAVHPDLFKLILPQDTLSKSGLLFYCTVFTSNKLGVGLSAIEVFSHWETATQATTDWE